MCVCVCVCVCVWECVCVRVCVCVWRRGVGKLSVAMTQSVHAQLVCGLVVFKESFIKLKTRHSAQSRRSVGPTCIKL